ncbi:unnamed protein product [Ilex paraguariensis]|uniref:Cytochrome c oxidase subunit 5C n=1 Tax=Ilex paraguariensis TaxID=185542 RepID=A0ABC8U4X4_9AQUA
MKIPRKSTGGLYVQSHGIIFIACPFHDTRDGSIEVLSALLLSSVDSHFTQKTPSCVLISGSEDVWDLAAWTWRILCFLIYAERMGGAHKIGHAVYKGPSVLKEIMYGISLGLMAGGLWKMHHWNLQRRYQEFYDLLERGEISVVVDDDV